jgi:hypothetical protein
MLKTFNIDHKRYEQELSDKCNIDKDNLHERSGWKPMRSQQSMALPNFLRSSLENARLLWIEKQYHR